MYCKAHVLKHGTVTNMVKAGYRRIVSVRKSVSLRRRIKGGFRHATFYVSE